MRAPQQCATAAQHRVRVQIVVDQRTQTTSECRAVNRRSLVDVIVVKREWLVARIVGRVGVADRLDVVLIIGEVTCVRVGLDVRHIREDLAFREPYHVVECAIERRVRARHDLRWRVRALQRLRGRRRCW